MVLAIIKNLETIKKFGLKVDSDWTEFIDRYLEQKLVDVIYDQLSYFINFTLGLKDIVFDKIHEKGLSSSVFEVTSLFLSSYFEHIFSELEKIKSKEIFQDKMIILTSVFFAAHRFTSLVGHLNHRF